VTAPGRTVEIWTIAFDLDAGPLAATLSAAERERAARFHSREHERRWAIAHGALRTILAERLGCEPAAVEFRSGEHGKPELAGREPCFSLSHCDDLALVAVADAEVGVDVEPASRRVDAVPRVLTPAELATLPADGREAALLRLWCRKEALAKARGTGMAIEPERLDTTRPDPFVLLDLEVPGHTAALAAEGEAPQVSLRAFRGATSSDWAP
jgi:4'-phosphopantetheinyl transferase